MDVEKWKAALRKAVSKDKTLKLLVLLGICGVALIYLSTLFKGGERNEVEALPEPSATEAQAYQQELEQGITRVIRAMTGEEAPTVLVTLESSSRHVYAANEKAGTQRSDGEDSEENETEHVILKDADGAQHALPITEIQPEIKGVVIVSRCAGDPAIREKLTEAVRTALNVSSARVCVTDSG